MDIPTSPTTSSTLSKENPSLPHLVLNLDHSATQRSSKPSDSYNLVLHPSTQLNLLKPQVSLLIHNPSLPLIGMQTAIAWQREQLLAAWHQMDERNHTQCDARMIPVTWTTSQILDTALDATDHGVLSQTQHPHSYPDTCTAYTHICQTPSHATLRVGPSSLLVHKCSHASGSNCSTYPRI